MGTFAQMPGRVGMFPSLYSFHQDNFPFKNTIQNDRFHHQMIIS